MKSLVFVFALVAGALARPKPGALSGSYLPADGGVGVIGSSGLGGGIGIGGGGIGIGGGSISIGGGGLGLSGIGGGGGLGLSGIGGGLGIGGGIGIGGGVQEHSNAYFYAAPDDEGASRIRINIAPSAHKNTKIIFVKAPGGGPVIPEVNAPTSHAEDRTLVYVLVRKQDQGGEVSIPAGLGVRSSKPEVFYIKYRNQAEAEAAVNQGLAGAPAGPHLQSLDSASTFVRTLGQGIGGGIIGGGIGGGIIGGGIGGGIGAGVLHGGGIGGGSIGTRYGAPGLSGPY